MKAVFVQPPFKNYAVVNPPLGLAYLAAVVRQPGCAVQVSVIDANAEQLSVDRTVERIIAERPDLVGVTMTSPQAGVSLEIIRQLKARRDVPVIVGGPHPTVMEGELAASSGIDVIVRSEGEETVEELCRHFQGGPALDSIRGISFTRDGRRIRTPDRPLVRDLDRLPFPAWELFPLQRYSSIAGRGRFSLPVISSRGCPFGCIFCYKGVFGSTYRTRSPQNVLEELRYISERFGVREFTMIDDNFALDEERAVAICEGLIRNRPRLSWRLSNSVAVKSSSSGLFRKLRQSGCYQVSIGVESGNQGILDFIGKGISLDQIRTTFRLAREAGLETVAFFMIGNLSEEEKTIDDTIRFAIELDPDFAQFTVATPYPGTRMYELVKAEGRVLAQGWDEFASYAGGAVFEHGALGPALLERKYREAYRRFYLRPRYILRRLKRAATGGGLKNLFGGAGVLLRMVTGKKR